jgi:hypothetical protein
MLTRDAHITFIGAQLVGGALAHLAIRVLDPDLERAAAQTVVPPHPW